MVDMNRTTSVPKSVPRYVLDNYGCNYCLASYEQDQLVITAVFGQNAKVVRRWVFLIRDPS